MPHDHEKDELECSRAYATEEWAAHEVLRYVLTYVTTTGEAPTSTEVVGATGVGLPTALRRLPEHDAVHLAAACSGRLRAGQPVPEYLWIMLLAASRHMMFEDAKALVSSALENIRRP